MRATDLLITDHRPPSMTRSKKIFLGLAAVFLAIVGVVSYDFGRRTTFPGSKPQLQERLKKQYLGPDSAATDSLKSTRR
jgi:hypothetical protein